MNELEKLPNIGKMIAKQLNEVDIYTYDDLKQIGSQEAWLKIKKIYPNSCINKLRAIEGAIQGIDCYNLSEKDRERLNDFYITFK